MRLWKTTGTVAAIGAMATLLAVQAVAQDDKVTVPFRDASKPRTLVVNLLNGSITVHGGGSGNEVVVEGSGTREGRGRRPEAQGTMHRIDSGNGGYEITEDNNVITVHAGMNSSSLSITVPTQIALKLKTVNGGKLTVDGVSGDIDAENTNGPVTITNCSGSVLANSLNGKVLVTLNQITAGKEMSFSSMNGNVDVTLPADTKANLKMRTDNGEIWSDFEVKLAGGTPPAVEDNRKNGGRYKVKVDKSVIGSINGGGPEMRFQTFNGSVYIRIKK
jgi:hypothetical protein